jgi:hypothetical protein
MVLRVETAMGTDYCPIPEVYSPFSMENRIMVDDTMIPYDYLSILRPEDDTFPNDTMSPDLYGVGLVDDDFWINDGITPIVQEILPIIQIPKPIL